MTVCHRHQRLIPVGERCGECAREQHARRAGNSRRLGRNTQHWRRLSKQAIALAAGICPDCGRAETANDPSTKLTCDLVGGGDHRRATLDDVRVRCRRCHGSVDGGRGESQTKGSVGDRRRLSARGRISAAPQSKSSVRGSP